MLIFIVELLNSAIEAVVDCVGDEPHRLSIRAKDLDSVAVLMALILLRILWFSVIIDYLG
ncbi:MAG: diacylglycerol kinase [Pseudomonadota bacterium]|nr:diacylglycerol kinase [Pseudomonadota bacterium]MEE2820740.1 diacylglycerol kinase [Pseudomonadota bacterium]